MTLTLDAWERRLRDVPRIIQPLSFEAVEANIRKGVNVAQGVVPFVTGQLQSSISVDTTQVETRRTVGEYSAKAPYAKFVEEGVAGRFGPRRYMQTSARIITPKFKRDAATIGIEALQRSLT